MRKETRPGKDVSNAVANVCYTDSELTLLSDRISITRQPGQATHTVQSACQVTAPRGLDPEFHELLEATGKHFGEELPGQVPWWSHDLCWHRDDMHGIILIQIDPPLQTALCWMWGKKSPRICHFLQLVKIEWGDVAEVARYFGHNSRWYDFVFKWEALDFTPERLTPFDADGELAILPEGLWLNDHYHVTDATPVPLDVFVAGLPRQSTRAAREPKPDAKRPSAPPRSVMEEYPWLARIFPGRSGHRPGGAPSAGLVDYEEPPIIEDPIEDPIEEADVEDLSEAIVEVEADPTEVTVTMGPAEVMEALALARLDLPLDDRSRPFYVQWKGGNYTEEHMGVAVYRAIVCVRHGRPTAFCEAFSWPKHRSWSKLKYDGEENVRMLANEFCRRASFFYNTWVEQLFDPAFSFAGSGVSFTESEEYLNWALSLDVTDACFDAVLRDKAVYPRP